MMGRYPLISIISLCLVSGALPANEPEPVATIGYRVVGIFPHRASAFTQGFELLGDNLLLESTGLYGESSLAILKLDDGKVLREHKLPAHLFGEGATRFNGYIYQLTWQAGKLLVYHADTLELDKTFDYTGQGWGLTNDGTQLIMSDGSTDLIFRSPVDFKELKRITVTQDGKPRRHLNELEWAEGVIYANVWNTSHIVAINPADGVVIAQIDIGPLYTGKGDVANGIAWDPKHQRLLITGKQWHNIFAIRLNRLPSPRLQ